MFNDRYGLTEAVLDGRKTMTRRIIAANAEKTFSFWSIVKMCWRVIFSIRGKQAALSRYARGEVVAIAQSYKDVHRACNPNDVRYKPYCTAYSVGFLEATNGWNNKMFTRADIMPHHIKITDIKVERLQDIPEEECLREGIRPCNFGKKFTPGDTRAYNTAREAFASLIDKVGKKGTWSSNPWVFCYSFELID